VLTDALAAGGDEAKRAFNAMLGMKKIDIAAIKAARLTFHQCPLLALSGHPDAAG
jgi:hypothetical protein